jgi:pyruvate dehydrogenase E1 component beta subunit
VTESVRRTGRAVVVDESPAYGGVSAEVTASIQEAAFEYLDAAIVRISAPHSPVPNSPPLLSAILPNSSRIEAAVRTLVSG